MTKVVPFSKETFNAVKANPGAFDEERTLGSFTEGSVVCEIMISHEEGDEGYYDGWPNTFEGKYVIEALIDLVGLGCYDEKEFDGFMHGDIPFTNMGEFPVYLEDSYEKTIVRFRRDFYDFVLKNRYLTNGIFESEKKQ